MVMMLDGTLTVHSDPRFSDLSGELTHKQGEAVSITIMVWSGRAAYGTHVDHIHLFTGGGVLVHRGAGQSSDNAL